MAAAHELAEQRKRRDAERRAGRIGGRGGEAHEHPGGGGPSPTLRRPKTSWSFRRRFFWAGRPALVPAVTQEFRRAVLALGICAVCQTPIAPTASAMLPTCLHAICRACVETDENGVTTCAVCGVPSQLTDGHTEPHPVIEALATKTARPATAADAALAAQVDAHLADLVERTVVARLAADDLDVRDQALAAKLHDAFAALHQVLHDRERELIEQLEKLTATERTAWEAVDRESVEGYLGRSSPPAADDSRNSPSESDRRSFVVGRSIANVTFEIDSLLEDTVALAGRCVIRDAVP